MIMNKSAETVDVVISFDTTGSMYPCLTQVRRKAASMVQELFRDIPGIRIGVIAHGDYCDGSRAITMLDLTDNKNSIIKFIETVPATNGGDAPECYELVLHKTRSMAWRSGKNKVLVLIGDDVPHGPSEPQNTLHLDWRNELKLLLEAGIGVYAVQALGRRHATPFYKEVADTTGGFHLAMDQFSNVIHMIKAVCYKQVGNERVEQYEEELVRAGSMTREVDTIISILVSRKTSKRYKAAASMDVVPAGRFQVLEVDREMDIKTFAESNGLTFQKGRGFYEFTKPVDVQAYKEVILMDNNTGDMYTGAAARKRAGIPEGKTARVSPGSGTLAGYTCFIQSTSSNRKLLAGTKFLYEVDGWSE